MGHHGGTVLLQSPQQCRLLPQLLLQPLLHRRVGAGPGAASTELPLQAAPVLLPVLLPQRRACAHPGGAAASGHRPPASPQPGTQAPAPGPRTPAVLPRGPAAAETAPSRPPCSPRPAYPQPSLHAPPGPPPSVVSPVPPGPVPPRHLQPLARPALRFRFPCHAPHVTLPGGRGPAQAPPQGRSSARAHSAPRRPGGAAAPPVPSPSSGRSPRGAGGCPGAAPGAGWRREGPSSLQGLHVGQGALQGRQAVPLLPDQAPATPTAWHVRLGTPPQPRLCRGWDTATATSTSQMGH